MDYFLYNYLSTEQGKYFSYISLRYLFLPKTEKILLVGSIANLSDTKLVHLLLYGDEQFDFDINSSILKQTISFLKNSERFDMTLL